MFGKLLILVFSAVTTAFAATVDFTEAGQHVGEDVTVTGKVSRVSTIPSGMTFINFGTRGDANSFTAVARPGVGDPEILKGFEGKVVEVTGTIEVFKDSPQIVLKTAEAISLPGEMPVSPEGEPMEKPNQVETGIKTYSVPLEKKEIKAAGKSFAGEDATEASVAIALPKDFKPENKPPVLLVFPDFFNDGDLEKLITPYAEAATKKGWIVIGARDPILQNDLPAGWHAVIFQAVIRQLSEEYPGIAEWPIYLAGNADGATRATLSAGALVKEDYDVRGIFLSSLKREDMTNSMETFGPSKMKMKKIKVFVSHGDNDNMVSEQLSIEQTDLIRDLGIKEVRHENHDGKGWINPESLGKAIEWFEEPEK